MILKGTLLVAQYLCTYPGMSVGMALGLLGEWRDILYIHWSSLNSGNYWCITDHMQVHVLCELQM